MNIGILDLETTGFLNAGGKIVEIGIVSLDTQSGEIARLWSEVCHERPITLEEVQKSWIVANSTLTEDDIRYSKQLSEQSGDIQDILDTFEDGVTAYNNAFDFGFMENRGFEIKKKLPCPMKLLTDRMKLPAVNGRSGYKWPKVEEAFPFFFPEIDYKEEHRAGADAWDEALIVFEMIKRGWFEVG